ncbi:hypothetical protein ABPG75_012927 [Micractinium tetrahymenae]
MASSTRAQSGLLSLPGELLAAVASLLDNPADRARLEQTCRRRHHSGIWWGRTSVGLCSPEQAQHLSDWLAARKPCVRELAVQADIRAAGGWPSTWSLELPDSPPLPCLAALKAEGLSMQASLPAIALHTALTRLELQHGRLSLLPHELSALTALRCLDPSSNWDVQDWERLAGLTALTKLDMDYCGLASLPQQHSLLACASFTGLHSLALGQDIPEEMLGDEEPPPSDTLPTDLLLRYPHLTSLELDYCGLTSLPQQLSSLPALSSLCTQLTRLHADYCPDVALGELSALSALRALSLKGCDLSNAGRAAGLFALSGLHHLVSLNIHGAHSEEVPAAVSTLSQLTCLDISYTGSSLGPLYGWKHLLPLRQLASLDLTSCGLTCIPPHLRTLTALQQLRLDRNPALATSAHPGWHLLEPLSRLTFLSLAHCGLAAPPPELGVVLERARVCTYSSVNY